MKPFLMMRLSGTQAEMGAQHGRLVAEDAARLFEFYATMPERQLGGDMRGVGGTITRHVIRGLATAWQARLTRERPPELVERSQAFAQAVREALPDANIPRDALRALATMDSMQNCVSLAARMKLGPFAGATPRAIVAAAPACSTAIAWGDATHDGELIFGRNFDFPGVGVWDRAPAFVVCKPDRGQAYGFFCTRGADAPVVTVINEAGLVLAPHTRWHRGVTFGGGMIVDLVHDIARRAETLADAERIARERPISSSWGLAVGSAREKSAMVLEIAGPQLEVVRPTPGASFLVCTNRYRTPALQTGQLAASPAWAIHSERREQRLRHLVEHRDGKLTPETIARFLGDRHDVSAPQRRRHMGALLAQATNVHCAVVTPALRRALVGVDQAPCCEGTFAELAWDWSGETGMWELGTENDVGLAGSAATDVASTQNRGARTRDSNASTTDIASTQSTDRTLGPNGFSARARTDVVAAHDVATRHVHEAARAYERTHDAEGALTSLERAIAADPDDPSLRLPAVWLALELRRADRALVHAHAGLAHETEPYRRGQLLLWGARAAQPTDPALARTWTDELGRMTGVETLIAASQQRHGRRPLVNLMMTDAY